MKGYISQIFFVCVWSRAVCLFPCPVIIAEHIEPFSEPLQTHEIQMSSISFLFFFLLSCQIRGYSRVVISDPPAPSRTFVFCLHVCLYLILYIPFCLLVLSMHSHMSWQPGLPLESFQDECVSKHD